jgi:hypothetical protein
MLITFFLVISFMGWWLKWHYTLKKKRVSWSRDPQYINDVPDFFRKNPVLNI